MTTIEITLIVIGIICVIVSIVMDRGDDTDENKVIESLISTELTKEQKDTIRNQVNDIIDEELEGINERTEASLDKISNTKILEMNEYAENVLGEINRNHNETVFLYDMLNEKAKEIKSTVKDVNMTKRQVEKIHSEVVQAEENKATQEIPAEEKVIDSKKNSKDIAKERLVELVKKSNERARAEDGSLRRNVQAETLENTVDNKAKDEIAASISEDLPKTNDAETETKVNTEEEVKSVPKKKTTTKKQTSTTKRSTKKKEETPKEQTEIQNIQFEKGATNNDKILKLNEMGFSNKDIAKQLNLGMGEVKLVIDLYKGGK